MRKSAFEASKKHRARPCRNRGLAGNTDLTKAPRRPQSVSNADPLSASLAFCRLSEINMSKQPEKTLDSSTLRPGRNCVSYPSQGHRIAADLYLPEGFSPERKYPTVIYTRVGTQVKEQTGATYGPHFAARGYIFMVFDPLNFGDSDIVIRNHETMHNVMPNTTDGISFLRTHDFVDRDRFFGLGLCGGAPYICNVALSDNRIKAVSAVVGNFDAAGGLFGTFPKQIIDQMLDAAAQAQQHYYETGEYQMASIFQGMPMPPPDDAPATIRDGYGYYFVRKGQAVCPNYLPEYPVTNLLYEPSLSFMHQAKYFTTPLLVVAGTNAPTYSMDKEVYENAAGEKAWFEIQGASQTDLYDNEDCVKQAVEQSDLFFKQHAAKSSE